MMTKKNETAERVAALEKELAEIKAALPPKPSNPVSDAEWRDQMHQMRERQANSWMPPSAIRDMIAAEPRGFMQGVVRDNRAPIGRPGMIPEQPSNVRPGNVPGSGTGWVAPVPLSPPPGVAQADRLMDAQDRRDRLELEERLAKQQAIEQLAKGKP
jgi:hypothetical protein